MPIAIVTSTLAMLELKGLVRQVGRMNYVRTRELPAGSLVLLEDHLNLMGMNPLIGPNDEALGPRFPSSWQRRRGGAGGLAP